jgi:Zn-dependent metalloprotease
VGTPNREQIEKVFFRAMNQLMPGTVTFQTTAAALRQAAIDLHGASSDAHRAIDESLLAAGL